MPQAADDLKPAEVTVLAVAASLGAHVLGLAVPLALLQTYDRIIPNQAYSTTLVLAIGVTVAIVLETLLRYGRAVLLAQIGAVFESRATLRMIDHLMQADGKAVHALGAPALSDAVRAVGQVRDFWSGNAAAALHELPFAVLYIALIGYIASWLALIPLVLTAIAVFAALIVTAITRRAVRDFESAEVRRRDLAWGIFGGIVEAKTMAAESVLTRRYRDSVAATMDAGARVENGMAVIRENGSLMAQIATIAIVTFGALMVVDGRLTTGGLAACTMLAGRSVGPVISAFAYLSRLGHRREAEEKIDRVLSLPKAPAWASGGDQVFRGGTIEISGRALQEGTVAIPQGSVVRVEAANALLATGLLEAVARLDDSLHLTIRFDGQPSGAFSSRSLRRSIAMASAHTDMIRGSLLENLTLLSPQYDADAIRLMQRLGLSTFVDGLRLGLMTPVGPAGANVISPGIAVRIGLIRALVRRPAILCLDEVGGALDLDGMQKLLEILKELKGFITVLMVTGNPALVALADQTIHVDQGLVS